MFSSSFLLVQGSLIDLFEERRRGYGGARDCGFGPPPHDSEGGVPIRGRRHGIECSFDPPSVWPPYDPNGGVGICHLTDSSANIEYRKYQYRNYKLK